jgi:hypothetical protein
MQSSARAADGSLHGGDEFGAGEGFDEKRRGLPLSRACAGPGLVEAGDEDDGRAGTGGNEAVEQFESRQTGKLDVEDQARGVTGPRRGERRFRRRECFRVEVRSVSMRCIARLMSSSSSTITTVRPGLGIARG